METLRLSNIVRLGKQSRSRFRVPVLIGANAISVAPLYWNQALLPLIVQEFPTTRLVFLLPIVTFFGYACGALAMAFGPASRSRCAIECHQALLVTALLVLAFAPDVLTLTTASCFVGLGAAVAQRLIAAAADVASPVSAGRAVSLVISGALVAICIVRLAGNDLGQQFGWRNIFFVTSGLAAVATWATFATRPVLYSLPILYGEPSSFRKLWTSHALLRRTAFQQAFLFAAYNAAWATALMEVTPQVRPLVFVVGGGGGLLAALAAGKLVDHFRRVDLAAGGAVAMVLATSCLLPLAYANGPAAQCTLLLLAGMACLDAAMQLALVANQVRVQALEPSSRTRLASILTICGALGSGLGTSAGYELWHGLDWRAAIGFATASAFMGFGVTVSHQIKRWTTSTIYTFKGGVRTDSAVRTLGPFSNACAAESGPAYAGVPRLVNQTGA